MSDHDPYLRLFHMRDYAKKVVSYTIGKTQASLETDLLLEDALRYAIGIIGEAASQIPNDIRAIHPIIPWKAIVGMRNFLFHTYIGIEPAILWETAIEDIPNLLAILESILTDLDRPE